MFCISSIMLNNRRWKVWNPLFRDMFQKSYCLNVENFSNKMNVNMCMILLSEQKLGVPRLNIWELYHYTYIFCLALSLLILIMGLDCVESSPFPKWYIISRLISIKDQAGNLILCLSGLLQLKSTFSDNQITSTSFWKLSGNSKRMIK